MTNLKTNRSPFAQSLVSQRSDANWCDLVHALGWDDPDEYFDKITELETALRLVPSGSRMIHQWGLAISAGRHPIEFLIIHDEIETGRPVTALRLRELLESENKEGFENWSIRVGKGEFTLRQVAKWSERQDANTQKIALRAFSSLLKSEESSN